MAVLTFIMSGEMNAAKAQRRAAPGAAAAALIILLSIHAGINSETQIRREPKSAH